MTTTSDTLSDSALIPLALHYGLATTEALVAAGSDLDALVAAGSLTDRQVAFLRRKGARDPQAGPVADDFMTAVAQLGYLTPLTIKKFAGKLRGGPVDRDYEAACLLHRHGVLRLPELIDVLEEIHRPLQYCAACQVAYYPATIETLDVQATCQSCAGRLGALTTLPLHELSGPPLPRIERLVVVRLDQRLKSRKAGQLVILLANHYRLITRDQAELLADGHWDSVQAAVQQMFEDGYLTTIAFSFLLRRAEEVMATKGKGTTGQAGDTRALELAMSLGYLSPESLDAFLEEFSLDMSGDVDPKQMDLAVIGLLYNRDYLQLYQAIDLLEQCAIVLDHCGGCNSQVLVGDDGSADCPACGVKMRRFVGWNTVKQLKRAVPDIKRLVVRDLQQTIEVSAEAAQQVDADIDGSRIVSLARADAAGPADPDDHTLAALIHRYALLAEDHVAEARKIQLQSGGSLFGVLSQFGFMNKPMVRFVRRRATPGTEAVPLDSNLLELGVHFGYLSDRSTKAKQRDTYEMLTLLGKAFNKGHFKLYQIVDLIETRELWVEHCAKCQIQVYFAPGESSTEKLQACPGCGEAMAPICRPGEGTQQALPVPDRFRIGRVARPDEIDADDDGESAEGEELAAQIILRYDLLGERELRRMREGFDAEGDEDLAHFLFNKGKLTTSEMSFLIGKQALLAGGEVAVGELADQPVTDIAQTKDYISPRKMMRLFMLPGAPDQEDGDDLEIACFLHARGALTMYQLVDILEEKGFFLTNCRNCVTQFHVIGDIDASADYGCPKCNRLLLPITSPPGWRPQLDRLPELESLTIERVEASALPVLRQRKAAAAPAPAPSAQAPDPAPEPTAPRPRAQTAEEILNATTIDDTAFHGLGDVPLMELKLGATRMISKPKPSETEDPGFKASWAERKKKLKARQDSADSTRAISAQAVQKFYEAAHPERKLKTRATKRPVPEKLPGMEDLIVQTNAAHMGPGKKSFSKAEDLVTKGMGRMFIAIGAGVALLLIAVIVGLVIVAGRPSATEAAKAEEAEQAKVAPPAKQALGVTPGQQVIVFGQVDPRSLSDDDKSFYIQYDIGQYFKIVCSNSKTETAYDHLARKVELGEEVVVKITGEAGEKVKGGRIVKAQKLMVHHGPLPVERVRYAD